MPGRDSEFVCWKQVCSRSDAHPQEGQCNHGQEQSAVPDKVRPQRRIILLGANAAADFVQGVGHDGESGNASQGHTNSNHLCFCTASPPHAPILQRDHHEADGILNPANDHRQGRSRVVVVRLAIAWIDTRVVDEHQQLVEAERQAMRSDDCLAVTSREPALAQEGKQAEEESAECQAHQNARKLDITEDWCHARHGLVLSQEEGCREHDWSGKDKPH
mmetsp:Transcript_146796/g.408928  ORF Transcript_146796/g.408928 Transcript_146796/m.408928 type:complete len:218 (-) Transcript_146796:13-666(-)